MLTISTALLKRLENVVWKGRCLVRGWHFLPTEFHARLRLLDSLSSLLLSCQSFVNAQIVAEVVEVDRVLQSLVLKMLLIEMEWIEVLEGIDRPQSLLGRARRHRHRLHDSRCWRSLRCTILLQVVPVS